MDVFQQPKCQNHKLKTNTCVFYDFKENINRCNKCITEYQINPGNLILIEELENEIEFIDNWPIFNKQQSNQIVEKIKEIQNSNFAKETEQKVIKYFDSLRSSVNRLIDVSQKKIVQKLQSIEDQKNQTIAAYKCKDQTVQLKQLWKSSLTNNEQKGKLKEFMDKKLKEQSNMISQVQTEINNYLNLQSQVEIKLFQISQQKIESLIENLDIFQSKKPEIYFQVEGHIKNQTLKQQETNLVSEKQQIHQPLQQLQQKQQKVENEVITQVKESAQNKEQISNKQASNPSFYKLNEKDQRQSIPNLASIKQGGQLEYMSPDQNLQNQSFNFISQESRQSQQKTANKTILTSRAQLKQVFEGNQMSQSQYQQYRVLQGPMSNSRQQNEVSNGNLTDRSQRIERPQQFEDQYLSNCKSLKNSFVQQNVKQQQNH